MKEKHFTILKVFIFSIVLILAAAFVCYPMIGGIPPYAGQNMDFNIAYEGIDLNFASAGLLRCVEGIGEKRALAIVEYRQKQNGFSAASELLEVPGIGMKLFEKIKDQVLVAGGALEYDAG